MSKIIDAFRGSMTTAQSIRKYAGIPLVLGFLTGACESGPSGLTPQDEAPKSGLAMASIMEGPYNTQALVTCNVTVATASFSCGSPQDPDPLLTPPIGGAGVFVRLLANTPAYVPDSTLVRVNMRVKNQLIQRIGTYRGPITGLKVFFVQLPTVTQGSGTVSVLNEDGVAEFTALNQRYFTYDQVLKSGQQSTAKWWKFNVPATVTSFRFKVYVSANILPIIAFDMSQAGNRDIYRVNADGTDLVRLTTAAGADVTPTVAQDRVIFTSYRHGNAELYSMPLLGGAETRLTTTPWHETDPSLTLNNANVAFVSTETGERRIWYGPATLATRTQIPAPGTPATIYAKPVWENLGGRIIYSSSQEGRMNLYRVVLSTGVTTLLIGPANRPRFEPKLNHGLNKVVHVYPDKSVPENSELYVFDTQTAAVTRLTNRAPLADIQPTFLHDDRVAYLYFTSQTVWKLRWTTLDKLTTKNITLPAQPSNPYGVPLR